MSEYDNKNDDSTLNTSSIPKDVVEDVLDFETGISTNTGFLANQYDDEPQENEPSEDDEDADALDFIPYVEYRQLENTEIKTETVYNGIVIWDEELEELDSITDLEREELKEHKGQSDKDSNKKEIEEEPEPEPEPEVTYTEDEYNDAIAKALAEGQSIGFDAGKEQALTEANAARQAILETLSQNLGDLKTQIEQSESEYLDLAVNVAMGIVKKLFPSLAFKYNTQEILNVIELAVELAATQPRLIVRVSAQHKQELEEEIFSIAQSHAFEGRLVVRNDENIGHTNVQIDWGEGSAIRDPLVILSRINNTLAGVIEKDLWNCDLGIIDPHSDAVKKDANSILSDNPTTYNMPGGNDLENSPPPANPPMDEDKAEDKAGDNMQAQELANPHIIDDGQAEPPANPIVDDGLDEPPMEENPPMDEDGQAEELANPIIDDMQDESPMEANPPMDEDLTELESSMQTMGIDGE